MLGFEDRVQDIEALALANRILAGQGVLDAFGHVSLRDPARRDRFFLARSMAPALVGGGDIQWLDQDGERVGGHDGKPYLERFIHSEIYRRRPDVGAIVHAHSPEVIPFAVTPVPLRPVYHMSAFLGAGVPVFDIAAEAGDSDLLIRSAPLGGALAQCLGEAPAALMRGHGSVTVGATLRQAVFRAVYLVQNARLQAQAMQLGEVRYLSPGEAALAGAVADAQVDRPWELWAGAVACRCGCRG